MRAYWVGFSVLVGVLLWTEPTWADDYGEVHVQGPRRVRIFLDDEYMGVTTKADGGLILKGVRPGVHVLRAVWAGFPPQEVRITVKAGGVLVHKLGPFARSGEKPPPEKPKPSSGGTGSTGTSSSDPQRAPRTGVEELVYAFQPLVARPPWTVKTNAVPKSLMLEQAQRAPKSRRSRYAEGWQGGHSLSAEIGGSDASVECMVSVFDTPKHAAAFVALERMIQRREKSTKEARIKNHSFSKGAGRGSEIPGFFLHRTVDFGGPKLEMAMHFIHRGRFAAVLTVSDAPQLKRESQWRVLEYADAFLRDPAIARELPKPDLSAPHGAVILHIQTKAAKPVAGALVWIRGAAASAKRVGPLRSDAFGIVQLEPCDPSMAYTLEIAPGDAMAKVGRLRRENWSPARETIRLEAGWTLQGSVCTSAGKPVAGVLLFKQVLAGWPPAQSDATGRFEVSGLPKQAVQVLAVSGPAGTARVRSKDAETWTTVEPGNQAVKLTLTGPATAPEARPSAAESADLGPLSAQEVIGALSAPNTPAFATAIADDSGQAKATAAALATDPVAVGKVAATLLERHVEVAGRDGDAAIAVADWVVRLAAAARQAAPDNAAARAAIWQANLARGRIGLTQDEVVQARHWCTAADYLLLADEKKTPGEQQDAAYILALSVLQEAAKGKEAPLMALADHGGRVCRRILKALSTQDEVRRAIAASFKWQAKVYEDLDRNRTQVALRGFFDTFAPIAEARRAHVDDLRAWNKMVSVVRRAKLDLNTDYIARKFSRSGLTYEIPRTEWWNTDGRGFTQMFEARGLDRSVDFTVYEWSSGYGAKGSVRTVGGDNVKGLAGRSFDAKVAALTKTDSRAVKKKKKPSRMRFNKTLPPGIGYTIEYADRKGQLRRIRCFLVKSVKAEVTIQISIYETAELDGTDPEWLDVVESFDVKKKKR